MDYTPDITMQPWYTAAYPYQSPYAPAEEDEEYCDEGYGDEYEA